MMLFLRGLHLSFWLFASWVVLRVWEPNFEVSPLPDWTLTAFIFLVLALVSFLLGRRLFKRHILDRSFIARGTTYLILGAIIWEIGLTIYLSSWKGVGAMFTWRFLVGIAVQVAGILLGAWYLKRKEAREMPEGVI